METPELRQTFIEDLLAVIYLAKETIRRINNTISINVGVDYNSFFQQQ